MPIGTNAKQNIKLRSDPEGQLYVDGFPGGLNTLTSPQHIADNECSILLNAQISEDGVITRRSGSVQYDTGTDGTRVFGIFPFTTYNSSGVKTSTLLKVDNSGNLKKWTGSAWSTLTGFTFQAGNLVDFAQSDTTAYIVDGKNPISTTNGSTVTTFSTVTNPSGGLAVSTVGTAGQTPYSYAYTYTTQYGETAPCTTVTITTGNQTLNTTNYNQLTITRATDSHITGYNVYGNAAGYLFYLGWVPQTTTGNATFNDEGATPNTAFAVPVANTTSGPVASMIAVFHDTILLAGDPANPSTLRYSAGLDKFDSFQLVDGAGFISVNKEDGDEITALVIYKNSAFIFKNRSIYQFQFGTGANSLATITIVNPSIGCAAKRTARVVLNDVFFLSPAGAVFTLGYQQGVYGVGVADLLRTNEVSIKVHPTLATINPAQISSAASLYSVTNYSYILAYADGSSAYNNKMVVYDSRYGAWTQWDDMDINCLTSYINSSNQEIVLYGDDNAGKVVQMFSGSSDQGNSFTFRMRTKDFNVGAFHLLKTWVWPTIHFRNISGSVTLTLTADGANTQYTNTVTSTTSYTGWSYDRWANFLWGTTAGSSATATAADAPRQVNTRFDARSLMFLFENTSTSDQITILGVESRYITRVGRRLPSEYILN